MTTQNNILQFENHELWEAIILKKNKRRREKNLNLIGEESREVELYSSTKVAWACEYQAEKKRLEKKKNCANEARKVQRAANALKNKEIKNQKTAAKHLKTELKHKQG